MPDGQLFGSEYNSISEIDGIQQRQKDQLSD